MLVTSLVKCRICLLLFCAHKIKVHDCSGNHMFLFCIMLSKLVSENDQREYHNRIILMVVLN